MECSCEIDVDCDNGESVDNYKSEMRVARKEFKCGECANPIVATEMHEYVTYMFEGVFGRERTCNDCLSARRTFFSGGFYHSMIWDDIEIFIEESEGAISESCISELTPVARAKVCDMVEKYRDTE